MTKPIEIKHEVAFSFLAPDLALAAKFAEELAPLSTFVFSRKQEELAGTDGQASFRSAFRFDSRLNVILFRHGWGDTPWTRVEQTAIQERCLADGWDRLLVVRLDDSAPPNWMPEVNLYLDLRTFPFEQAIGAIKRQVQFLGGKPAPPAALDVARNIARKAAFDAETKTLFRTPDGIKQADDSVVQVAEQLHSDLQKIAPDFGWNVAYGRNGSAYAVVRLQAKSVLLNWERYTNSADGGQLTARVLSVPMETPDEQRAGKSFRHFSRPTPLYEQTFEIYRTVELGFAWKRGSEIVTSEQIAGELLGKLVQSVSSNS